jgi:Flp pilus assembly protein TadB
MNAKDLLGKLKEAFSHFKLPRLSLPKTHRKKQSKPQTFQEAFHKQQSQVTSKFDNKKKLQRRRMSKLLKEFLEKAGHEETPAEFNRKIMFANLIIVGLLSFAVIVLSLIKGSYISDVLLLLFLLWTIVLLGIYLVSLLVIFVYLDIKIYQRTKQIEDVLPDFLQLASANISAGMPIDKALWFAVRPRFGVLAVEMEEIAKATITGSELEDALINFTKKYDSRILKESMNLIIAGLKSGGELAELLTKISENIQATKIMKKEISASVTTYVIFIAVASIGAAPGLFALSSQLLAVIGNISQSFDGGSTTSSGGLSMSFSGDSVDLGDFTIFAVVLLIITSYFASAIVATIQTGSSKEGLKKFPLFVAVSLVVFFAAKVVLGMLMGGLF